MAKLEKERYYELIHKIDSALNLYKNTPLRFNVYKMYLSNGQALEFKFEKHQIAHLLGVNTAVLKKYISSTNAFDSLEEMINNCSHIYSLIQMGVIDSSQLFSPFIEEKLEAFELIFSISLKNTSFVCKHDQMIASLNGVPHQYKCLYYIFLEDKDKSAFLGIRPDDNDKSKLVPVSSTPVANNERRNEVFRYIISNQEVMFVNSIQLKNIDRKEFMSYAKKLETVNYLNQLVSMYHVKVQLTGDFEYTLKQCLGYMEKDKLYNSVITLLIDSMKNGEKVYFDSSNDKVQSLITIHNETTGNRRIV